MLTMKTLRYVRRVCSNPRKINVQYADRERHGLPLRGFGSNPTESPHYTAAYVDSAPNL